MLGAPQQRGLWEGSGPGRVKEEAGFPVQSPPAADKNWTWLPNGNPPSLGRIHLAAALEWETELQVLIQILLDILSEAELMDDQASVDLTLPWWLR